MNFVPPAIAPTSRSGNAERSTIVPAQLELHRKYQAIRARLRSASGAHFKIVEIIAATEPVPEPEPESRNEALEQATVAVSRTLALRGKLPVAKIIACVSLYFRVPAFDIISDRRTAVVVRPRQIVMYLARTMTTKSFPEIARCIGDRDHTTALHGFRKITRLIETDPVLAGQVAELRRQLEPAPVAPIIAGNAGEGE